MSSSADFPSKYALPKFSTPASQDRKLKRMLAIGSGVAVLWAGALGGVLLKRNADEHAAREAARQQASRTDAPLAASTDGALPVNAQAEPLPPPVAEGRGTKPETASADTDGAKRSRASKSRHDRRRQARRQAPSRASKYAARTPTVSKSPTRLKDNQLDALLKQFK